MKRINYLLLFLFLGILSTAYAAQRTVGRFSFDDDYTLSNGLCIESSCLVNVVNPPSGFKSWKASGAISLSNATDHSVIVHSTGEAKGRLTYIFDSSDTCSNSSFSLDVYKRFDPNSLNLAIQGPDCVVDSTIVVYSINPILTKNINSGIGMDTYQWFLIRDGQYQAIDSINYVAGDGSSITFNVGRLNGTEQIAVQVGQANGSDKVVRDIGKSAPKPQVEDLCLPYNQTSFIVDVYNEKYPDLDYIWDFKSNWIIQYLDRIHKSRVQIQTPAGATDNFSVSASFDADETCTTASKATIHINRSWSSNVHITAKSSCIKNLGALDSFMISSNAVPDNSAPTWVIPSTWETEFPNDETSYHHTYLVAHPVNSTNYVDTLWIQEETCFGINKDSILVFIAPAMVDSITDNGCIVAGTSNVFRVERLGVGPAPVAYNWYIGNTLYKSNWVDSITCTLTSAHQSIRVQAIGKNNCNSDFFTLPLTYSPSKPDSIIWDNEGCIAYNMQDTLIFHVANPTPYQKYEWSIPMGWTIIDYNGNSTLKTSVRVQSNGVEGTHRIYVKGVGESGALCNQSDSVYKDVTINSIVPSIQCIAYGTTAFYIMFDPTGGVKHALWRLYDNGVLIQEYSKGDGTLQLTEASGDPIYEDIQNSTRYTFIIDVTTYSGCQYRYQYGAPMSANSVAPMRLLSQKKQLPLSKVVLSPNPAQSEVRIEILDSDVDEADIYIYDMSGQLVYNVPSFHLNNTLDISTLQPGNYAIFVNQENSQNSIIFNKQ